jgi:hypothetical protein
MNTKGLLADDKNVMLLRTGLPRHRFRAGEAHSWSPQQNCRTGTDDS